MTTATATPTAIPGTRRTVALALVVTVLMAAATACGDDDSGGTASPTGSVTEAPPGTGTDVIVFSTEGNNLNAYRPDPPFEKQTVIRNADDDPADGMDINGQICFFPDDPHRFIAGEDTGQPERTPGWGIFEVEGDAVGSLSAQEVGRLVPTYQGGTDNPENYGCGVLADGRVVTTDIGNQASGAPTGQLIVWFPPFDRETVAYCKIDVALPTPGGIAVDSEDRIYVTSARPPDNGVLRYSGPYPSSDDAAGGCGGTDATGAPLADGIDKTLFIPADDHALTPNAVVPAGDTGGFYVASAFTGTIVHYNDAGEYVETLLAPPEGEAFGAAPYSTGSPFGLAVGPDGTVFFADLGLGMGEDGVGPLPAAGSVRRLLPGEATPEVLDSGLEFPDGIGVYRP
jgi:hypothetical protein